MFSNAYLIPPCEAGRAPGRNNLMCERCGVGLYAPPARSFCQECPEGGKNCSKMCKLRRRCQGYTVAQVETQPCFTHLYCAAGSTPSADRTTCENCLMMHYSVSGMDECVPCNLPLALVDNRCVSGQSIRAMHALPSHCLVLRYCNI